MWAVISTILGYFHTEQDHIEWISFWRYWISNAEKNVFLRITEFKSASWLWNNYIFQEQILCMSAKYESWKASRSLFSWQTPKVDVDVFKRTVQFPVDSADSACKLRVACYWQVMLRVCVRVHVCMWVFVCGWVGGWVRACLSVCVSDSHFTVLRSPKSQKDVWVLKGKWCHVTRFTPWQNGCMEGWEDYGIEGCKLITMFCLHRQKD